MTPWHKAWCAAALLVALLAVAADSKIYKSKGHLREHHAAKEPAVGNPIERSSAALTESSSKRVIKAVIDEVSDANTPLQPGDASKMVTSDGVTTTQTQVSRDMNLVNADVSIGPQPTPAAPNSTGNSTGNSTLPGTAEEQANILDKIAANSNETVVANMTAFNMSSIDKFVKITCPWYKSCGDCVQAEGCGWCAGERDSFCRSGMATGPGINKDGEFLPGAGEGRNCTQWNFETCPDMTCESYETCDACVQDPTCGWCSDTATCMDGDAFGITDGSCEQYDYGICKYDGADALQYNPPKMQADSMISRVPGTPKNDTAGSTEQWATASSHMDKQGYGYYKDNTPEVESLPSGRRLPKTEESTDENAQ